MTAGKKPFEFKICPACKVEKPRADYYKKGNTVSYKCKPCTKIELIERAPKYFGKYAEYQKQWKREQTANNTAFNQRRKELKKARYEENKDKINAKRRHIWATVPDCSARKHNRRHDVKHCTPHWVDLNEIVAFYAKCPKGFEVDHIIPIKGKIDGRPVSGLHVLWNLQHLPAEENRKKYCLITESYLAHFEVKR